MKFVFNNPDTVKESKEPDCSVNGSNSTAVSADTVLEIEYSDLLADYGDKSFHDTSSLKPRSFASMQLRAMYSEDDGNTEVFYMKDATATIASFTKAPEVIKF